MLNEQITIETDAVVQSKPKTSKMAIFSVVFGILGPLSAGTVFLISLSNFMNIAFPFIMSPLSYSVAWILGLAFGVKSLEQIEKSEGQLLGKEYAIIGIVTSAVWMFLILVCFLMPAIFSVNS